MMSTTMKQIFTMFVLTGLALGQSTASATQSMYVTIFDKKGRPVEALAGDALVLTYDRKPVTAEVKRATTPVDFVVVLDTSRSEGALKPELEERAALNVFRSASRLGGHATLVSFATTVDKPKPVPSESDFLQEISGINFGGATSLYDAVQIACQGSFANPYPNVRRAVFIISDGDDNQSRHTRKDAIEDCQQAHASIFSILISSFGRPGPGVSGTEVMKEFALKTGGVMLSLSAKTDVTGWVSAALQNQYQLSFVAPQEQGTHEVRVRSADKNLEISAPARFCACEILGESGRGRARTPAFFLRSGGVGTSVPTLN